MDTITHLCISNKLRKLVKKELNVKLNTFSFFWGSIKPDLSSKYIKIPHYKRDSNKFIQDEIKKIINTKVYEGKSCSNSFSERLGIITHYLADFFCFVHSDLFKGNMSEHLLYEIKMLFNNIKHFDRILSDKNHEDIVKNHSVTSICENIDILNDKYLAACTDNSYETDMIYTLTACSSLCISIISECLASERKRLTTVAYA